MSEIKGPIVRARLDADRTAKPLTQIQAVVCHPRNTERVKFTTVAMAGLYGIVEYTLVGTGES